MKVIIEISLSGPSGSWAPGQEYECDKAEAERLVAAGIAKHIEGVKPGRSRRVSKATAEPSERAVSREG